MKCIFNILFLLCFPFSFCFAGVKEDFRQDLESSAIILRSLNQKIDQLKQGDYEGYFCIPHPREDQLQKAKTLFTWSQKTSEHYFLESASWSLKAAGLSETAMLGQLAFKSYCIHLPLIKNLYNEKNKAAPDSLYFKDLEQCIEAINIYPKYFFDQIEATYAFFLKIEPNGKQYGLPNYAVYVNENNWFLIQRRQIRNILHRLAQLDLEKLDLPQAYKDCLYHEITEIKKAYLPTLNAKVLSNKVKQTSRIDLSQSPETYRPHRWMVNPSRLVHALEVAFSPLNMIFSEGVTLSEEEREQNRVLLEQLLEKREQTASTSSSVGRTKIKKGATRKKRGAVKLRKPESALAKLLREERPGIPLSSLSPSQEDRTTLSSQSSVIIEGSQSIENQALYGSVKELVEDIIGTLVFPITSELSTSSSSSSFSSPSSLPASSSYDPAIYQDENESRRLFVKTWLADIKKASQSKEGTFGIFQKALTLESMITKHSDLLEQVEEATSGLAKGLQLLEEQGSLKPLSQKIPDKVESDFLYFMETPLRYLKSLRFGFVHTLLENLGVIIKKDMAGDHIQFSFKGKKGRNVTSIHLHDKHNGELDGGRISSLRRFLIDCGFISL